jgi:hypothetical protein
VHLVRRTGLTWTRIDNSSTVPDGVEVVARGAIDYDFQPGGTSTARSAVAARALAGGVEIGTYLAAVDTTQATMLNQVFGLLGGNSSLSLSLVSWQGLAGATVTLGDLAASAGSGGVQGFLTGTAALGNQLSVMANALTAEGNATAAGQVQQLTAGLSVPVATTPVSVGSLVVVTGADPETFGGAQLNVLELARGALMLGRTGSALSGSISSGVFGIGNVSLSVRVVHPPTIAFGPIGTSASTGQVEVTIGTTLAGLVPIQLSIGAATGTATLAGVTCPANGAPTGASVTASTQLAGLSLTVAGTPVSLGVTAVPPTTLAFTSPFTWAHRQRVGGTSLGLAAAIGGALGPLGPFVAAIVNPLLAPLENLVVTPILNALGVSVAGADVAALAPTCGTSVLKR